MPPLRTRQGLRLLALLILRRRAPIERSLLAAELWPDSSSTNTLFYLRRSLNELRQAFGAEAYRFGPPAAKALQLDLAGAFCDLAGFDAAVRHATSDALAEAIALYRGPLLEGWDETWLDTERRQRQEQYLDALLTLARHAGRQRRYRDAIDLLRQAVAVDPLREACQLALMEMLAASGEAPTALQVYQEYGEMLRQEMGAEPGADLSDLAERLRSGRTSDPAPFTSPDRDASPAPAPIVRLPRPLTSLIGRGREIEQVCFLLTKHRMVTLTGSGGVGKTRLAIAVAEAFAGSTADGAVFVDLAPLTDPALVPHTLLGALELRETAGQSPLEALRRCLAPRDLLLVWDNCEHLIDACATLAAVLLSACPDLRLLTTSRQPLEVEGEQLWRVSSLETPPEAMPQTPDADLITTLTAHAATRLFLERARLSQADLCPTPEQAHAIIRICRRLDGIPLAIEMAAARARAWPVEEIAERLDDRFLTSTNLRRTALRRQQTLHALIDWSWQRLSEPEKLLLTRLAIFAGGWTLDAAEKVCADQGIGNQASGGDSASQAQRRSPTPDALAPKEVWDLLAALVDKSLIAFEKREASGRYRMLAMIREFAAQQMPEADRNRTRKRFIHYFLHLVETAEPHLKGAAPKSWFDRLEQEQDNLRAALAWWIESDALREGEEDESGPRLAAGLCSYWGYRGHASEGRRFMTALLGRKQQRQTGALVKLMSRAGALARQQGDYSEAQRLYEQALEIGREIGDRPGEAEALSALGGLASDRNDFLAARRLQEQALTVYRELGDRYGEAVSLASLGYAARQQEDFVQAKSLLEQALAIGREIGARFEVASTLGSLAHIYLHSGDHAAAGSLLEQELEIWRELGNRSGEAWVLCSLGGLVNQMGDYAAALSMHEQALEINRADGNRAGEAWNLCELGATLGHLGDLVQARRQLERALTLTREVGSPGLEAAILKSLGDVVRAQKDDRTARRIYGEALALMQSLGLKSAAEQVTEALESLTSQ